MLELGLLGLLLAAAIIFALVPMHLRTNGRSSPVAALAFVVTGPVLGVLLFVAAAVGESTAAHHVESPSWGKVYGFSPDLFFLGMFLFGMVSAAAAASVFTALHADEFRGDENLRSTDRPVPTHSAALRAFGLTPFSGLEELEQVYRERTKAIDLDQSGSDKALKKLAAQYERAKKQLGRSRGMFERTR